MCGLATSKGRAAQGILFGALRKDQHLLTLGSVLRNEEPFSQLRVVDDFQAKRKEFADWVKERDTVVKS
jgi:hypothetical protein